MITITYVTIQHHEGLTGVRGDGHVNIRLIVGVEIIDHIILVPVEPGLVLHSLEHIQISTMDLGHLD